VHDHVNGRLTLRMCYERLLTPSKGYDHQWLVMSSKQVPLEIGDQDLGTWTKLSGSQLARVKAVYILFLTTADVEV
jgi:hypothetical protein